jgi:hypothetical protein
VHTFQVVAALMSHFWYQDKFGGSYPRHRKAVIPWIL